MDRFQAALDCLHESLELSQLPPFAGEDRDKADIYGAMADLLTDLGQFEEAAQVRLPTVMATSKHLPCSHSIALPSTLPAHVGVIL